MICSELLSYILHSNHQLLKDLQFIKENLDFHSHSFSIDLNRFSHHMAPFHIPFSSPKPLLKARKPSYSSILDSSPASSTIIASWPSITTASRLALSPTRSPLPSQQPTTNGTQIIVRVLGGVIGTLIFICLVWRCCYNASGLFSLESRERWVATKILMISLK